MNSPLSSRCALLQTITARRCCPVFSGRRVTAIARHPKSQCKVDAAASGSDSNKCSSVAPTTVQGRRQVLLASGALVGVLLVANSSDAVGFTKEMKKKKIPLEDYTISEYDGLQIYELAQGSGKEVAKGDTVTVHFDCKYKSLDVVSTRAARLLAGNRTVAEPFVFAAGGTVDAKRMRAEAGEGNGLFSGQGGPEPPPALSTAVLGMKKGGKRSVIVPAEVGYGSKGMMEIPPGAPFELQIEVLNVQPAK